ncbi:MAG: methylated-DNA--[protein]-cysteine S-methyltransferase [Dehalococcoidia bacterium]|nr:methylated-DNA--[protein]-cysteine S-methyltransferase [Dehalococcoidia bacterium]
MAHYDVLRTPIGDLFVGGSAEGIHRIDFLDDGRGLDWCIARLEREAGDPAVHDPEPASEATRQLREYFAGARDRFDLPLAPRGSEFQLRVWLALREIPPGATTSYGAIARAVGRPSASRAVGAANGQNPISIVVPCHRVIGASGALTGYGGGLDRKRWLLNHETSSASLLSGAAR